MSAGATTARGGRRSIRVIAGIAILSGSAWAKTPSQPSNPIPKFDVVSIRPCLELAALDGRGVGGAMSMSPGGSISTARSAATRPHSRRSAGCANGRMGLRCGFQGGLPDPSDRYTIEARPQGRPRRR